MRKHGRLLQTRYVAIRADRSAGPLSGSRSTRTNEHKVAEYGFLALEVEPINLPFVDRSVSDRRGFTRHDLRQVVLQGGGMSEIDNNTEDHDISI